MGLDAPKVEDKAVVVTLDMKYLIMIVILGYMFLATGCAKKEAVKPKGIKAQGTADASATDPVQHKVLSFNLEGLDEKGAKKWDVNGESAEAVSETEIRLDSIVAKAYGEEAEATITADKGVYDKVKNNVRLEKNVKATIENTQTFAQDFVNFPNQMTGQPKSKNLDADTNKKTKTIITCEGEMEFNYEKNQAYFSKNVKVANEEGRIDADRITVNLDPDTRKIKDIVAEGSVIIKRGENVTYSEKATYIEAENRVVLTGNPKVVIYQEGGMADNLLGK